MTKFYRSVVILLMTVYCSTTFAQVKPSEIFGSWLVTSIKYKDDTPLPDEDPIKYIFVKYLFDESNVMYSSTKSHLRGEMAYYQIKKDQLIINNTAGAIMSTFLISKIGKDTLNILRKGAKGFADPKSLKYTFVREHLFQQALSKALKNDYTVSGVDTIYNQSPVLYAKFYQPAGFEKYVIDELKEKAGEQGTASFRISFIVDKKGVADSVKIVKGIWKAYDDMYLNAFKKVKSKWKPAMLNGKPVSVRMYADARYVASGMVQPSIVYSGQGDDLYATGKYDLAIQYYDAALKNYPDNEDNLYRRAICKIRLDDIPGALVDLKAVKDMRGNMQVDELIVKYSK